MPTATKDFVRAAVCTPAPHSRRGPDTLSDANAIKLRVWCVIDPSENKRTAMGVFVAARAGGGWRGLSGPACVTVAGRPVVVLLLRSQVWARGSGDRDAGVRGGSCIAFWAGRVGGCVGVAAAGLVADDGDEALLGS